MVLGLIDFLLGGKKKTKVPRSGQVVSPLSSVGGDIGNNPQNSVVVPDGQNNVTQNSINNNNNNNNNKSGVSSNKMQFENSNPNLENENVGTNAANNSSQPISNQNTSRKPIAEVINKIHLELKNTNEKISQIVTDVKTLENSVNTLGHRIDDLEESKKEGDEKILDIDRNMTKFLSLYELINNQYNPFVEQTAQESKQIVIDNLSASSSDNQSGKSDISVEPIKLDAKSDIKKTDLDSTFLNLDTLNIEKAANSAVPLVKLKNDTNSLVTILSWLEYLIKREGVEKSRDSLRYYTDTLKWITPEVFFDLDKYLRGMKDRNDLVGDENLTTKDHIVSLYFISKLNEKVLDKNLTTAVLQIIKE